MKIRKKGIPGRGNDSLQILNYMDVVEDPKVGHPGSRQ